MRLALSAFLVMWISAGTAWAQAPLTLQVAIERARALSPARTAALARVEAADQAGRAAGRWPNPLAEFRAENFWSGAPGGLPLDTFATLTQAIEFGGERGARKGAAAAALEGARAGQAATAADADLRVVRRFLDAVRAREIDRALTTQLASLDELVRVEGRRVAEGLAPESDLHKLEAERARVELDRVRAQLSAARSFHELLALVGPEPAVTIDALQAPPPPALPTALDEAAITAALDRRPDVAAARAQVTAAREALRFEEARTVPDLAVTGGWKRTGRFDTGVLGVAIPVPLFDRNQVATALAKGQLRAAELELSQVVMMGAADIRATREAARALAGQADRVRTRLMDPATAVRASTRAAFESGAADMLRVVDAERVYTDAQIVFHTLASEAVVAAVEARIAVGEDPLP